MIVPILLFIIGVLVLFCTALVVMVIGAIKQSSEDELPVLLSGRDIEVIRRKLYSIGIQGISAFEVKSLIRTHHEMLLGTFTDPEPYFPADPYEDV